MPGSHNDAILLVELAKWGAMIGLDDASSTIFAEEFDPNAVEANDPSVRAILMFNETVGTLVKNGLLDRDLVYDWLWIAGSWERVGPAAKRAREKIGVLQLFENYEALAAGQRELQPAQLGLESWVQFRMVASEFDQFVEQYHQALDEFFRGNPEPAKMLYSHRKDASLANPIPLLPLGRRNR